MINDKENRPWISLIILLVLTLICAVSIQVLTLIGLSLVGVNPLDFSNINNLLNTDSPFPLYTLLATSSLGTFLLPAVLLNRYEKSVDYFPMDKHNSLLYLSLIFGFLVVCNPLMELISNLNMQMQLPDSFRSIESWMREKEDGMAELTEQLVMVDSIGLLLVNLVVMAIIPAIVEEFYFRGSLQNIAKRIFGNAHAAIWITAIIFSAIHVQFYGFFPRMFLGVIFGYAFFWTNNIWIPIFGHFLNNASVTILAFIYHKNGKSFEDLQSSGIFTTPLYIISIVLTIVVGYYFYKISAQNKRFHESKLD